MKTKKIKMIISGGGTGGHIFPAIAIANAVKSQLPDTEILFIGAEGKMEMEKVPNAGYQIQGLPVRGLQRSLSIENLKFPFRLHKSIKMAGRIIKQFKPDIVVGVGGYASGPTLWAASKRGIPTLIQEQNSYPGITNKLLAKKVSKICVAYDSMERFFPAANIIKTGNPIRSEVIKIQGKKNAAAEHFKLDPQKPVILIVGGSLGALAINKTMVHSLKSLLDKDAQFIWQTGSYFYPQAQKAWEELKPSNIKVVDFIPQMDLAYAVADIIISRAGAIAIAEISTIGKAAIFVPLPTAAEDHQTKNAMALVEQEAALLIPNDQTNEKLIDTAFGLLKNNELRNKLEKNILQFGSHNAAKKIADEIIKLC